MNDNPTEARVFTAEDLPKLAENGEASQVNVEASQETDDNNQVEEVIQTDPTRYQLNEVGQFVTLQLAQNPTNGQIEMGIVNYPVPLDMVRRFQDQLGDEMAKENMKLVIYKGRVFLAPIQTSRLIIPT